MVRGAHGTRGIEGGGRGGAGARGHAGRGAGGIHLQSMPAVFLMLVS